MVTEIHTISAAPAIISANRKAECSRMVWASARRADVVSATVTANGIEVSPVVAARYSVAMRIGSVAKVPSVRFR